MRLCPTCGEVYADSHQVCPRDGSALKAVRDPLVGRTVAGRYRLISRLGSGGMSSVYLARHVMIDRLVAGKTLRRDLAQDPVQRDRFIREARAVNRINHENIVEITDFGETEDGLVYLLMEYVPGDSLLKALGAAPFDPHRALHIAEQIGGALGRAHQMGVVHRDLKPENVLLQPRKGGRDFVKILDFGIAKILDAPSLTGSQQIFGTPGYIAPEYIQSTDIDGRADLYSLGVILYEMVTGALPFDYEYPGDLLVKHVTEAPVPPRERQPGVEAAMEALILRCLEKDPAERFRDAYHFVEELRKTRERLGGESSWGGLNEPSARPAPLDDEDEDAGDVPTPVLEDALQNALLRRTMPAPPPPDMEVDDAPEEDADDGPDTLQEEWDALGDEPSAAGDEEPAIPTPPELMTSFVAGLDGTTAPRRDDGLVGVRRWRARFDALRAAVDELREQGITAQVEEDLEFATLTLENLEAGIDETERHQAEIEELNAEARDFRATLGRAIDQLGQKLSKARGSLEELAKRRNELRARREAQLSQLRRGGGDEGEADAVLWELATVEQALREQGAECDAVEAQLGELRAQLEGRNEAVEARLAALVAQTDAEMIRLDGLSNALRSPLDRVEAFVQDEWSAAASA
ncbi:MAG: hypothetical protein CMN31_20260 [Sandaracinus sp.]|nr:hypothetical protein [Sandaracinus sp.]